MGQNMAIGLVTEIQVAKKDTQRLQYDMSATETPAVKYINKI